MVANLNDLDVSGASQSGSQGTQPTQDVEQQLKGLAGLVAADGDQLDQLRTEAGAADEKADRGFLGRLKDNPIKAGLQALLVAGGTAINPALGLAALGGATQSNAIDQAKNEAEAAGLHEKIGKAAEARRQTMANLIASGQGAGLLNPDGSFPEGSSADLFGNMLGLGVPFHPGTVMNLRASDGKLSAMAGFLERVLPQVKSQKGRQVLFTMMNGMLGEDQQFQPEHIMALANANEVPVTFDKFIEIYPSAEGMAAAIFADLNGLDYSDARVLELAGSPVGKVPTTPASDKFKEAAWQAFMKLKAAQIENPDLIMMPAAQLASTLLDEATLQVLKDEIPGFEEDDGDQLLEHVFAASIQATLLADAIRLSKDPNAKPIADPDKLSELILRSFNNIRLKLRKEKGSNLVEAFDAKVEAKLIEKPALTREQARVEVAKDLQ